VRIRLTKGLRPWPGPSRRSSESTSSESLENTRHRSPVETAWPRYQHRACLAVSVELWRRSLSVADFAHELGADPPWLIRKLHGQTLASLGDFLEWSLHLGVPILPPSASVDDLLPPTSARRGLIELPSGAVAS